MSENDKFINRFPWRYIGEGQWRSTQTHLVIEGRDILREFLQFVADVGEEQLMSLPKATPRGNDNCLRALKCPHCGQFEAFDIEARSTFRVTDEGVKDHSDVVWGGESAVTCAGPGCGWFGTVAELSPSDEDRLIDWLRNHPDETLRIAQYAVLGLWIEDSDVNVIGADDDFPSGASYIDHVNGALPEELHTLIKELQEAKNLRNNEDQDH